MHTNQLASKYARSIVFALMSGLSTIASASTDNFENGVLGNWQHTTNGGVNSIGVENHNGSLMAFVVQTGAGPLNGSTTTTSSLARDFPYSATDLLSFDMHAVASTASGNPSGTKHSGSGVRVSFLNAFNISQGSFSLYNYTNSALLGAREYLIDSVQHNYSATMATFAAQAGLGSSASISKVNLTFLGWAQYSGGGNIYPNVGATSRVWFDNVTAGQIPEPAHYVLLLLGLALMYFKVADAKSETEHNDA